MRAPPFADSPEFQRLVTGAKPVHLARIALEIAQDAYPDLDLDAYLHRIGELTERVRTRCAPTAKVRDVLGQINWVLFVEEEMRGNREDYYDPRNSYLNEVLDRRLGIPISLSVLYWAVAEPLGLSMGGVNLPAHFMLRVNDREQPWFVDAFHAGALMNPEDCQRRLSEILHQAVTLTDAILAPCSIELIVTRRIFPRRCRSSIAWWPSTARTLASCAIWPCSVSRPIVRARPSIPWRRISTGRDPILRLSRSAPCSKSCVAAWLSGTDWCRSRTPLGEGKRSRTTMRLPTQPSTRTARGDGCPARAAGGRREQGLPQSPVAGKAGR